MILECVMTCPHCGFKKEEVMPQVGREMDYICGGCGKHLAPKKGDCCVYCSWSNMICPPMQDKRNCCSG